jgi:hypothetical protein
MRKIRYSVCFISLLVAPKTKNLTKEYTVKAATLKFQNIGEVVIDFQTQLLSPKYVCSHMYSLADQRPIQSLVI